MYGASLFALLLVACASSSSPATSTTPKPAERAAVAAPSSPEHERVKRIVHAFETSPLSPDVPSQDDRTWLVSWLTATHEIRVFACPDLLGSVDDANQYPHSDVLLTQTIFGQAVFQLDHMAVSPTDVTVFEAGLRTAIATYRNILSADAGAHWPSFDKIVAMDGAQLRAYVTRVSAGCI